MRCLYCEAEVTTYPENGICTRCGGRLPPRPAGTRCPSCGNYDIGNFCSHCGQSLRDDVPPVRPPQPGYIPAQQMPYIPGIHCPKCRGTCVVTRRRGFSWGLGLLGFFLIPVVGIFLGFCGSHKLRSKCSTCGHKWKHR